MHTSRQEKSQQFPTIKYSDKLFALKKCFLNLRKTTTQGTVSTHAKGRQVNQLSVLWITLSF